MVPRMRTLEQCAAYFKEQDPETTVTRYRIEQLEKKVDKHNTVIERTYKLEETQAVMEEQIKVAKHRIADLENQKEDSICR